MKDKSGKTLFSYEYRSKRKSGEYRWFKAFGDSIRDANGNPTKNMGFIMDITELKEEIAKNNDLLSKFSLINTALNAVVNSKEGTFSTEVDIEAPAGVKIEKLLLVCSTTNQIIRLQ